MPTDVVRQSWSAAAKLYAKAVARGSIKRATLNLTEVEGAILWINVARGGTTAITTTGPQIEVRRTLADAITFPGSPAFSQTCVMTAAAQFLINNGAGYAAGTSTMAIDGTSGTPAVDGDFFAWGATSLPADDADLNPNAEFFRCAAVSASSLTVDAPTKFARVDNEIITTLAESYRVTLAGGNIYEIIVDYKNAGAGETLAASVYYQTLDYYLKTVV